MRGDADEAKALRRIEVDLPRRLRTQHQVIWGVKQVAVFGTAMLALPLVSRIPLVIPWLPGWAWLIGYVLLLPWWLLRRFRRSCQELQEVVALIRAGDMEGVQPRLERALAHASGPLAPQFSSLLGNVEIELGRTERGLSILESARRSGWYDRGMQRQARGVLYASLAAGYADLGDERSAANALDIARRDHPPTQRGLLLADEAHVLARAGRHAEVCERVAADLDAAEQLMPAWSIKWIRVLHGFSRAALGSDYRTGADEDVGALLADKRVRSSVVRLAARWPEFRAFLAAHGVTVDEPAPA